MDFPNFELRDFVGIGSAPRLDTVANVRVHHSTGQRPLERIEPTKLNQLPDFMPDCRELCQVKVHKDFAVRFDGNTYTTPPWTIGKKLTVKADAHTVTVYLQTKKVAVHYRCWQRYCRIENDVHQQQVKKLRKRLWHDRQVCAFASLGVDACTYLQGMLNANVPIKKNITKILWPRKINMDR